MWVSISARNVSPFWFHHCQRNLAVSSCALQKTSDPIQELNEEKDAEIDRLADARKRMELQKKRNKSRLRYSDRLMLYGHPPLAGLEYERSSADQSAEHKKHLLGMFGAKATGISPNVAWPTNEDLDEQREWESVFYDGMTLKETIEFDKKKKQELQKQRQVREEEIDKNFAKMEGMVVQWQRRIEAKNRTAEKEWEKKQRILAELRDEVGYDVDPKAPQFAHKIAQKEKEMKKAEKEAKKEKQKSYDEARHTSGHAEQRVTEEAKAKDYTDGDSNT